MNVTALLIMPGRHLLSLSFPAESRLGLLRFLELRLDTVVLCQIFEVSDSLFFSATSVTRDIFDASVLDRLDDVFRKLRKARNQYSYFLLKQTDYTHNANHLDRIRSRHVSIQSLPFRDPRRLRIHKSDQAFIDLRAAIIDSVRRAA